MAHAFVKFLGDASERLPRTYSIIDQVRESGCHWACTYPKRRDGGRPRAVADGDTMFIGRLTHSPNDIRIFGRAIARAHVDERDTASPAEIEMRPWKEHWAIYIRVQHPEFIAGRLGDAISLNSLMDELGANSFGSTQENLRARRGNTDPRRAYMRQPHVRLTDEGYSWLSARFERTLSVKGRVPVSELEDLDWPEHG